MVAFFYKWILNLQAHHQEILQKITLQQSLTDTSMDRCAYDGTVICLRRTRYVCLLFSNYGTHDETNDGLSQLRRTFIGEPSRD